MRRGLFKSSQMVLSYQREPKREKMERERGNRASEKQREIVHRKKIKQKEIREASRE